MSLPHGWAQTTVGEIAEVLRGVTYKRADALEESLPDYLPVVRATNIIGGRLANDEGLVFVPEKLVKPEQRLRAGDLVLATSSGSLSAVGRSAPVTEDWNGGFGAFCGVLRPNELVIPKFLHHYVSTQSVRQRWSNLAAGTNINNLKRSDIEDTPVPLPSLSEQRRIVEAIDELLSRLDAAEESLSSATRRVQILRRAVLGLALGTRPPMVSLGRLLDRIEAGKSFRALTRPAAESEWGIIKVSAMTWGEFREAENKALPAERSPDVRYEIRLGDLLLSRANTKEHVGASVLVGPCRPRLLLSDKSLRLIPIASVEPRWLHFALSAPSVRARMSEVATGVKDGMRNISQDKLRSLKVPDLPQEDQVALIAKVEEGLSVVEHLQSTLLLTRRRLEGARRSILREAFAGRLVLQGHTVRPPEKVDA